MAKNHGMTGTRFYGIWENMKQRAVNPSEKDKKWYKSVGISDEWHDFRVFMKDMHESYKEHCDKFGEVNTSIDRIDNDLGYSKGNCKWSTFKIQARNRGSKTDVQGIYFSERLEKWMVTIGVNYRTVHIGTFISYDDAVLARKEAEEYYWRD